ncbi:hypothetical protein [Sphingomonas abietis]|uniref:Uncharacterized protein n=1 Tax=Sphingomonas abietis TaxID=3012344 RepID=A0ABY7NKP5_9SPHN|nr:hypothetical protein [Sphingomonas abietis]WBO22105.1 hypothetical protein PBT88_18425 [Sphingomonas abietis]
MIEAVTAVARADAVAMTIAAGANARRTLEGRQKRMRWLDALRVANGEPLPIDDEARDEEILAENRRRIRAALGTIEELRGLEAGEAAAPDDVAGTVSASAVVQLMLAQRAVSIRAQAHLGAAAVRQLLR